jgi:predicted nucleotidyltransferase
MKTVIQEQAIAGQVVNALREGLGKHLVAVVLFGSRARDEARPDSDWDFLVIAENLPARLFERVIFLKKILPDACRGAASLLAKTPCEFETGQASLYLDIALDGIPLYDPEGCASEILSGLRESTQQIGLYRTRTDTGRSG